MKHYMVIDLKCNIRILLRVIEAIRQFNLSVNKRGAFSIAQSGLHFAEIFEQLTLRSEAVSAHVYDVPQLVGA